MKKRISIMSVIFIAATLQSCATLKQSIALGVGSGVATGAATGAITSEDKGNGALTGALVGGLVGGIASYFIHGGIEDRDKQIRKETLFNLEQFNMGGSSTKGRANSSKISFPIDSEETIPTHRKGNQVVEQHRVWTISDNAQWDTAESKKETDKKKKQDE